MALAAAAAAAAPAPAAAAKGVPLPTSFHHQRGANCRQVALGNLLRCAEPSQQALHPSLLQFTCDCFPDELDGVHAHPDAAKWTMSGDGFVCLMTYYIEAMCGGSHCAILGTPLQRLELKRALGGLALDEHLQRDRGSLGLVYFTPTHAMSLLRDEHGEWWDVPQSSARHVQPCSVGSKLRTAHGWVLTFSRTYVVEHLLPVLVVTAADVPLLAARLAHWLRPIPATDEARSTWHEARAQRRPLWTAAHHSVLAEATKRWLAAGGA
jgi:hypothetical protein